MSTTERRAAQTPKPSDLDDTAEMPGLPATDSPTDTWAIAGLAGPAGPAGAAEPAAAARPHADEVAGLRSQLATVTEARRYLEVSLSALTTNLRELEQRVQSKSEQLARHEREVAARDRRIAELVKDLAARAEQIQHGGAERDALQLRLERAHSELAELAQLRERYAQVQAELERGRGQRETVLAHERADLAELQRRVARQQETLQDAEGRRYIFDAMLREREQLLDERDARVRALQEQSAAQQRDTGSVRAQLAAEFDEQLRQAQERDRAHGASAAAAAARLAELEQQLTQARQERETALGDSADARRRAASLEAEVADHGDVLRPLQEQLRSALATNETLRGDLAAAEDMIRSAEGELQQREARVARLESDELALRSRLEAVDRTLDERNALIASLEATVAGISPDPGSLAPEPARPEAAAGPKQLLVCTEGDTGIVHLLSRRTTIGRTPDNDLRIDADFISRHHAVVLVTTGGTIVEDLNSTNGVFVNNVRIARRLLREGDLVTIGKTSFRYLIKPAND